MPLTDAQETALLNAYLGTAYTPPGGWWLGLSTTTPTDAGGNVTEIVYTGYARVQVVPGTHLAAATGTAPVARATNAERAFPQMTGGSPGQATHAVVFDASTAGAVTSWGPLPVPKTPSVGDTISVAPGDLVFRLGKPADSFT